MSEDHLGVDLSAIEAAAEDLLAEFGIACHLPPVAADKCGKAGLVVTADRVRFPVPLVMELLAGAPVRFTHVARDKQRSLKVSASMAAFGPAMIANHIWHGPVRRVMTAADAAQFVAVANDAPGLDYGASSLGLLASDGTSRLTAFLHASNRPLIVPSRMPFHARDLIAATREGAARDDRSCRLLIVAGIESALTLDDTFVEALTETAEHAQGLVVSPTLLIGANAPATLEGALVRFTAEAMAGVALTQVLCPGQPVAVGAMVTEVSMRNGLPIVGSANSLQVLGAAIAMARRWNLAFYACGPATNSKGVDALGTAETSRWLTAAHYLGANAILGAIGAVDLDDGVSIDKLTVDAEVAAVLGKPRMRVDDNAATELLNAGPGGYFLGTEAAKELAHQQALPQLASNSLFESWAAASHPELNHAIAAIIARTAPVALPNETAILSAPPLDRRPTNLADLASTIYSRSIRDAFGFGG